MLLADLLDVAVENHLRLVDQGYFVAYFLHRRHVVGREQDSGTVVLQVEYFLLQQLCVHRVETTEGFVKDEQRGFMQDGDDELNFLLHSLR